MHLEFTTARRGLIWQKFPSTKDFLEKRPNCSFGLPTTVMAVIDFNIVSLLFVFGIFKKNLQKGTFRNTIFYSLTKESGRCCVAVTRRAVVSSASCSLGAQCHTQCDTPKGSGAVLKRGSDSEARQRQ